VKKIFMCFFVLISSYSFGGTLDKADYKKIKAAVTNESSKTMLSGNFVTASLNTSSFNRIDITTDILSEEDVVMTKTTILPTEENCDCQDIFEVSMEIVKKKNFWTVTKKSIKVKHIFTDQ